MFLKLSEDALNACDKFTCCDVACKHYPTLVSVGVSISSANIYRYPLEFRPFCQLLMKYNNKVLHAHMTHMYFIH